MTATFTTPSGGDPATEIHNLMTAALPTEGDLLYALQRQRTRILQRTAAGVDVDGTPFQAYSAGYAKSKSKYGRGGSVDLRGRNAPNMLQAIVATSGSLTDQGDSNTRAVSGSLEFYDQRAALLAEVHNQGATIRSRQGTGKGKRKPKPGGAASFEMPRRHFFDASRQDLTDMENDMGQRSEMRKGRTP
jgi:hypothetical protein